MFTFDVKCKYWRQLLSFFQLLNVPFVIQAPSIFHLYNFYCFVLFVPILVTSLLRYGCCTIRHLEGGLKVSICHSLFLHSKTIGGIDTQIRQSWIHHLCFWSFSLGDKSQHCGQMDSLKCTCSIRHRNMCHEQRN